MVHIVKQVASALAATHAKGIVHRDLKPGNIFLLDIAGETDFVKVLDFGISKVRSATTKLTRTSSVMGTPELHVARAGQGPGRRHRRAHRPMGTGLHRLGMLAGEGPFVGENVPSILFQIVHEPPPALAAKVAGLHPRVEEVLLHALAKNKNDRFANVNDFALALECRRGRLGGAGVFQRVGDRPIAKRGCTKDHDLHPNRGRAAATMTISISRRLGRSGNGPWALGLQLSCSWAPSRCCALDLPDPKQKIENPTQQDSPPDACTLIEDRLANQVTPDARPPIEERDAANHVTPDAGKRRIHGHGGREAKGRMTTNPFERKDQHQPKIVRQPWTHQPEPMTQR